MPFPLSDVRWTEAQIDLKVIDLQWKFIEPFSPFHQNRIHAWKVPKICIDWHWWAVVCRGGTDKFLQLVLIFRPWPTMFGIFHKFGSAAALRRRSCPQKLRKLFSKLNSRFCFCKNTRKCREDSHFLRLRLPLAAGETLSHSTQIGATFIQYSAVFDCNHLVPRTSYRSCIFPWNVKYIFFLHYVEK